MNIQQEISTENITIIAPIGYMMFSKTVVSKEGENDLELELKLFKMQKSDIVEMIFDLKI